LVKERRMTAGAGYADRTLSGDEVESIVMEGLAEEPFDGRRVLVIVPDHTRTCPIGQVFPLVMKALQGRAKSVEVIVALGTHPPEDVAEVRSRLGLPHDSPVPIHMHEWDSDAALREAGCLEEEDVARITNGLFKMRVCVRANRRLFDADHLIVIGPVFPHEVVGMSGGAKYLFPGCSGPEVLNFFHWVGAVITNAEIIGVKSTPVREVVEAAAALVPTPKSAVKMVVGTRGELHGIWAGGMQDAWSAAADLSAEVHVTYLDGPMKQVLSVAPPMYDDLWTAGKCMYKLEPVVAEGGELIIYAPHVKEVSVTHGDHLDEVGYHVRDFFLKQWDDYRHYPWGVLAHSTHVKGAGTYDEKTGVETPRVNVVLATGIPEERCRTINLGYRDPATINPADFAGREDEGVLLVPKAGEKLFRLRR
jgi:nickel-dependent lactate racemase